MNSKTVLYICLFMMAALILAAVFIPEILTVFLNRPAFYDHILFLHIISVTLFFGNAVIGILWELRSFNSRQKDVILHTYETVSWLDAGFSSPLIILSVISGIMLCLIMGDFWQIGWLSLAFLLFILSGTVWVFTDIPMQYRIRKILGTLDPESDKLPRELIKLLKLRIWISLSGVLPLFIVFLLMVYKPDIKGIAYWL